jgi:hypothetical protein
MLKISGTGSKLKVFIDNASYPKWIKSSLDGTGAVTLVLLRPNSDWLIGQRSRHAIADIEFGQALTLSSALAISTGLETLTKQVFYY